jgi:predicted tellurium resistance membrane protein TerC
MMENLLTTESLLALLTLTGMEIVLGIDNIIFIAILVGKVPQARRDRIRKAGIALALISRLALLFSIVWIMRLTEPLFTILGRDIAGRDLILMVGGLFLVAKAVFEIHDKLESGGEEEQIAQARGSVKAVLIQIVFLDIVFSLDSVITAVGMAKEILIMVTAMVIAVCVMLFASGAISSFVERHPTIKILALSFLILIGLTLVMESLGLHVPKGYIYFAMFFSLGVELLNLKLRKPKHRVKLNLLKAPD